MGYYAKLDFAEKGLVNMALVTGIKAFTDNTDANPIDVNNNYNTIVTEINGLLDEENINLDKASFRAALLAALKAVDGTLSGLDSDLLDGKHYADIQTWVNTSADVPNADNADNATNAYSASTYKGQDIDTDGDGKVDNAVHADNADNATNADKLDGRHLSEIFDMFHPIGDIVHKYDSTNPSALTGWSGTWVRIGVGKMLIGQDPTDTDFDALGETGGAKTHTLTENEMPIHDHNYDRASAGSSGSLTWIDNDWDLKYTATATSPAGGDQAHNNMPPYVAVYIWRRTA